MIPGFYYFTYFSKCAVELLSVYAKTNPELARKCLTLKHEIWGNKDSMLLAVNAIFRKFVAHSCPQKMLEDIWRGFVSI